MNANEYKDEQRCCIKLNGLEKYSSFSRAEQVRTNREMITDNRYS